MVFKATGMFDAKNKSTLCVLKSTPDGEEYFGAISPPTLDGHVRIDIKRGYHFF